MHYSLKIFQPWIFLEVFVAVGETKGGRSIYPWVDTIARRAAVVIAKALEYFQPIEMMPMDTKLFHEFSNSTQTQFAVIEIKCNLVS